MSRNQSIEINFSTAVDTTVTEYKMLEQGDAVLAAVSGGPDSVALVLALLELKTRYKLRLGIAHVNHLLRGEDASRDAEFSENLAGKLDIDFHLRETDVRAHAEQHGLSIETAGREVRYDFLKVTARSQGYTKIATGHHKDDNAEMVLMNLLRGSGPKGLCGIPPVRENQIIRPLIRVTKKEIREFLNARKQPFMEDATNSDPGHLRNRVRHRLIPHLQSDYNPGIVDALDRLSRILEQEEALWQQKTDELLSQCLLEQAAGTLTLSRPMITSLEKALLNRLLRKSIKQVKGNLTRISHRHIHEISDFCQNSGPGASLDLPGQIRIYKTRDTIIFAKEKAPLREIGQRKKQQQRRAQNSGRGTSEAN